MSEYPRLSEEGIKEFQRNIDRFKEELKKAADEVIDNIWVDSSCSIESDSWVNFRNQVVAEFCDYKNAEDSPYDYKKLRRKMFEEYRAEIIDDLNQDLVKEVDYLKESLEALRSDLLGKDYYR